MNNKFDDLEKLNHLFKNGAITEKEYNREKEKILNSSNSKSYNELFGLKENTYCMLIHLSLFLGFIHVILGIFAPFVLWILNKDKNVNVESHGKIVLNWILSMFIYSIILFIIIFPFNIFNGSMMNFNFSFNFNLPFSIFSRFFPLILLMILNIIFIVIGALKANSGILWNYPLSIKFLKINK